MNFDELFIQRYLADRRRYEPQFLARFRDTVIYKVFEKTNAFFHFGSPLSVADLKQMLSVYLDSLFAKEAMKLKSFLSPKAYNSTKRKKHDGFSLVSSNEIFGNKTTQALSGKPSLLYWVYLTARRFASEYLLIQGIICRDQKVIDMFTIGDKAPSCRLIIIKRVSHYIKNTSPEIAEVVVDSFRADLYANETLRAKFVNFKYNRSLYQYIDDSLMCWYIEYYFNICIKRKTVPNIDPEKKEKLEPAAEPETKRTSRKRKKDEIFSLYNEHPDNREFIDKVFGIMSKTKAGRAQVEVMMLLIEHPESTQKEMAASFDPPITPNLFNVRKTRAMKNFMEIAKKLKKR